MVFRCISDHQVFAVAETDTEKADSVDIRSPGAIRPCVAEVHVDETGIAELASLEPHSSAYSGNRKPIWEAVAGR